MKMATRNALLALAILATANFSTASAQQPPPAPPQAPQAASGKKFLGIVTFWSYPDLPEGIQKLVQPRLGKEDPAARDTVSKTFGPDMHRAYATGNAKQLARCVRGVMEILLPNKDKPEWQHQFESCPRLVGGKNQNQVEIPIDASFLLGLPGNTNASLQVRFENPDPENCTIVYGAPHHNGVRAPDGRMWTRFASAGRKSQLRELVEGIGYARLNPILSCKGPRTS